MFPFHVVLYQPEIPQNTGNIGRTCVALGAKLWIVQPTGFRLDSSHLRRAGLDYWDQLAWESVPTWDDLIVRLPDSEFWFVTKFGRKTFYQAEYVRGCTLVVGRESNGLPNTLLEANPDRTINIPMPGPVRSLNQACAAAIVMVEAARQMGIFCP